MNILLLILLAGFGVFMIASLLVWAFRMQRFVESHGERSASVIFTGAMLRDYQTARRIADRIGRKPGFLILFERLFITAIAFFIAGVLALLIGSLK
jgi:hypothetical protein